MQALERSERRSTVSTVHQVETVGIGRDGSAIVYAARVDEASVCHARRALVAD